MNIDDNVPIPRLIDVPTVCAITSLSISRIYALIAEGELHRVKIGRKTLFVEADIRAWIEAKIIASGGLPPGWIDLEANKAELERLLADERQSAAA